MSCPWCPVFTVSFCSLCPEFVASGLFAVSGVFAACSQCSGCKMKPKAVLSGVRCVRRLAG
eukprot:10085035-Alexandrium_andersonii.AAC.1